MPCVLCPSMPQHRVPCSPHLQPAPERLALYAEDLHLPCQTTVMSFAVKTEQAGLHLRGVEYRAHDAVRRSVSHARYSSTARGCLRPCSMGDLSAGLQPKPVQMLLSVLVGVAAMSGCPIQVPLCIYICAGICQFDPRGGGCRIRLSEPLLKFRPVKDLKEVRQACACKGPGIAFTLEGLQRLQGLPVQGHGRWVLCHLHTAANNPPKPLLGLPYTQTLLHEMIHAYMFLVGAEPHFHTGVKRICMAGRGRWMPGQRSMGMALMCEGGRTRGERITGSCECVRWGHDGRDPLPHAHPRTHTLASRYRHRRASVTTTIMDPSSRPRCMQSTRWVALSGS